MPKISLKTLYNEHKTTEQGLKQTEAEKRLEEFGPNTIEAKKPKHWYHYLAHQFLDLMVIVLIVAVVISIAVGELSDGLVILGIVILNAIIGLLQEYKTDKALEALKSIISLKAKVYRDGELNEVDRETVVPGDIVRIEEGDKIPADCILIEASALKIDEAILTGESVAVEKCSFVQGKGKDDKHCKLFMGTLVAQGEAKALVISTGKQTEFGQIAHLTQTTKKDKSPLQMELNRIGVFVAKITVVISVILFIAGLLQGQELAENFLFAVSVAVAAVPEGLPATITIALAMGVQRLAQRKAIMKQLTSVETLGSTSVICSDKTGTLTKNQMTVTHVWTPHFTLFVEGSGYDVDGEVIYEHHNETTTKHPLEKVHDEQVKEQICSLAVISHYCNNSEIRTVKNKTIPIGDPTEVSLQVLVKKLHPFLPQFIREAEEPFTSEKKYMSVTGHMKHGNIRLIKGASEIVLKMCEYYEADGNIQKITESFRKEVLEQTDSMSDNALRVLALAKEKDGKTIFTGLIGMIDPPRPEVRDAIKLTHDAGIKTIIITGDYLNTAYAIAKDIGLHVDKQHTMLGSELEKLSDEEVSKLFKDDKSWIFSRVNPVHKMKVVNALKQNGEVVAVTGDGVNDAPALKRADIGISMGITGTEVSKEAANMILVDDSFATIVNAVKEGRTIYDNLKKFVYYIFSCNIGELITVFAALVFEFPVPLTAILILCIDIGTDILPALALGIDQPEQDIMKRPPRNINKKIMDKNFILRFLFIGIAIGTIVVAVYIYVISIYGWKWGEGLDKESMTYLKGSTAAFATLIIIQMVNAYNARSEKHSVFRTGFLSNKYLIGAILISLFSTWLMIELPFLNKILHTVSLNLYEWTVIITGAFLILLLEEARKFVANKYVRS